MDKIYSIKICANPSNLRHLRAKRNGSITFQVGIFIQTDTVFTVSNFSLPVRAYISIAKEPESGNYAVRRYISIENMKPLRGLWKVDNPVSIDMYALTGNG